MPSLYRYNIPAYFKYPLNRYTSRWSMRNLHQDGSKINKVDILFYSGIMTAVTAYERLSSGPIEYDSTA